MVSNYADNCKELEKGMVPSPLRVQTSIGKATSDVATPEIVTPVKSYGTQATKPVSGDEKKAGQRLIGKVGSIFQKGLKESRHDSVSSQSDLDPLAERKVSEGRSFSLLPPREKSTVRETKNIFLEYDPISRRKVLNSYEVLREIGRGEHGKVKLAKDLVHNELVAIKIVNRKSKYKYSQLRIRNDSNDVFNDYETKIRREIAIMKRCDHKHIVKLKELLDDSRSNKIYLVLEYLEKGEIRWKRLLRNGNASQRPSTHEDDLPCRGGFRKKSIVYTHIDEASDLLSDEFSPNLTFKQSRRVFRDVLLGLEYLHLLGIVHRDIKPANLLVSADNVVKISDFGVSFASCLDEEDAKFVNEVELTKTAGTPAFFAPELCETNFSSSKDSQSTSETSLEALKNESLRVTKLVPRIDYKIDIWALGVTLYCLLFGRVPFNANSEYELFQVIVNKDVEFPNDRHSFNSVRDVDEDEFELAKDLLSKMMEKDPSKRIEISDIKKHPFVQMDIKDNPAMLDEFLYLNSRYSYSLNSFLDSEELKEEVRTSDLDEDAVGIGGRIRKSLLKALEGDGKDIDMRKYILLQEGSMPSSLTNSSSEESSSAVSRFGSGVVNNDNAIHSFILSEGLHTTSPPTYHSTPSRPQLNTSEIDPILATKNINANVSSLNRTPSYSFAGSKDRTHSFLWKEVFESNSCDSSRRGSSAGIEAAQIETKRNVGGDLYLKNQSIVDTFKDIQEKDLRRRKSSANAVQNQNNPHNPMPSILLPDDPKSTVGVRGSTSDSVKLQPIDINSLNNLGLQGINRLPSSAISLPLSASIESLDSFDDAYFERKFGKILIHDSKKNREKDGANLRILQFDSKRPMDHDKHCRHINEKFKNFDLSSLMRRKDKMRFSSDFEDDNAVPPNLSKNTTSSSSSSSSSSRRRSYSLSSSCHSSSSDNNESESEEGFSISRNQSRQNKVTSSSHSQSQSESDSDSESESEEEGNLTLAFSSKLAPPSRPHFLSFNNRSVSHDSHMPSYRHRDAEAELPITFQDKLPIFEDLPANLMTDVSPNMTSTHPTPSVSIISSNASTATLTVDSANNINKKAGLNVRSNNSSGTRKDRKEMPRSSKERKSAAFVSQAVEGNKKPIKSKSMLEGQSNIAKKIFKDHEDSYFSSYHQSKALNKYKNHYNKIPKYRPFPNALHADNDKESASKASAKRNVQRRPSIQRFNSVSIGVLSHSHDLSKDGV